MLKGILYFEWRFHTRRLTFLAAAAYFMLMGFMLTSRGQGNPEGNFNSAHTLAYGIGLLSLTCVFPLTLFCAQSILRDQEYQMAEIVYSTAITKPQYLLGRFGGVLAAAVTTVLLGLVGMAMGTYLMPHDPTRLGPFDLLAYLGPFTYLVLPNILFAGAVLFAVAVVSRSTLATYVGGVFLYVLYFLGSLFTQSPLMAQSAPLTPEGMALASLADPFGLAGFFEQTHYWSIAERNTRHLALEGHLLLNRALWTGLALAILAVVYRVFAFRLPGGAKNKKASVGVLSGGTEQHPIRRTYQVVPTDVGRLALWTRALASATRLELRYALKSWPFLVLLVMWTAVVSIDLLEVFGRADYGTRLIPTTALLLGRIQEPLGLIGLLMLIYYSAELVWRERVFGMDEIVDATPASNSIFLLSKAITLSALIGVLTTVAIGVAGGYQLLSGQSVEIGLYASVFYFTGLPLVLVAILALFIQTLTPNRYVGMLVTLVAVLVLHKGGFGGPSHPLLRYATSPEVYYSAMSGFSPLAASFTWFMAYWTAFAGLLALVVQGIWRRGTDPRLRLRLAGLRSRPRFVFRVCLLVFVVSGFSIFYQTNVINAYETAEEVNDWKAEYEKTYRHLESEAEPSLAHLEMRLDLYPEERRYGFSGRARLENRTQQNINTVWLAVRDDVTLDSLELGGAQLKLEDKKLGMYQYVLEKSLAPGGAVDLTFEIRVYRSAVTASGTDYGVISNGSFLLSHNFMPSIGYRLSRELQGAAERRRRGLPEYARPTTIEGAQSTGIDRYSQDEKATFDATISTSADQTVIAPGELRKTWEEGGRRYFNYVSEKPLLSHFAFVSGRYDVKRQRHAGVDVEIFYHPEHAGNVDRFMQAAVRSLEYCSKEFSPYQHPHLRLVEIPSYWKWFRGMARPGVIYYVEDAGFLTDYTDPKNIDIVTKRVAHEVSHQWWGGQLSPAPEPGASTLVESLARYTELMVLEDMYGKASIPPVLENEMARYLRGRTRESEVPLYQVGRQGWLYYAKGALVMTAMADLVGEEAVNRALRDLLAESLLTESLLTESQAADPPDSLDLLRHLYAVTPEQHHGLLDEWWKQTVLYDLSVESASYAATADGRFQVTLEVKAGKSAVEDGEEIPLDLNEDLDIALFSEFPSAGDGFDSMFYEAKYRVTGETTISLIVDEPPSYVGIDPYLYRIERNRVDNVTQVEEVRSRAAADSGP